MQIIIFWSLYLVDQTLPSLPDQGLKKHRRRRRRGKGTTQTQPRREQGPDPLLVNLSADTLSEDEETMFSKGLSFVPTQRTNTFQTKVELFKFFLFH